MTTKTITLLAILIGTVVTTVIGFGTILHTYNSAAQLKNVYEMKISANASEFDNLNRM